MNTVIELDNKRPNTAIDDELGSDDSIARFRDSRRHILGSSSVGRVDDEGVIRIESRDGRVQTMTGFRNREERRTYPSLDGDDGDALMEEPSCQAMWPLQIFQNLLRSTILMTKSGVGVIDCFEHVDAEERLRRQVVLDCIRSLFREMKRVENGTEGGGGSSEGSDILPNFPISLDHSTLDEQRYTNTTLGWQGGIRYRNPVKASQDVLGIPAVHTLYVSIHNTPPAAISAPNVSPMLPMREKVVPVRGCTVRGNGFGSTIDDLVHGRYAEFMFRGGKPLEFRISGYLGGALEARRPTTTTIFRADACISADGLPWVDSIPSKVSDRSEGTEWIAAGYPDEEKVHVADRSGKVLVSGKDVDWLSAPFRVIETPEISEPSVPLITAFCLFRHRGLLGSRISASSSRASCRALATSRSESTLEMNGKRDLQLLVFMDVFFRNFSPLPTCNVLPLIHTPSRITWDKWFPKSASIGSLFTRKPCKDQTPTSSHTVFALSS
ncbi:hypothetical protein EDD85DRAFT_783356 [Armillaria nabsnona]|nr:hypothetical protein EDD85DRAFT_783356 [Armillaria nabsnona]